MATLSFLQSARQKVFRRKHNVSESGDGFSRRKDIFLIYTTILCLDRTKSHEIVRVAGALIRPLFDIVTLPFDF